MLDKGPAQQHRAVDLARTRARPLPDVLVYLRLVLKARGRQLGSGPLMRVSVQRAGAAVLPDRAHHQKPDCPKLRGAMDRALAMPPMCA